jgi:type II secretory pathway predicted ATPase ExeA
MAIMRAEVMEFYGLARSPRSTDYYETAHHRKLLKDIRQAVYDSDLIALCGVVGSGKTVTLRRLQDMLAEDGRVLVSKSVAVEKDRATLGTLITALFCDLTLEKEPKIPKQGELRERELRKLAKKRKKPIVLIIDEAHDLHRHTLTGLKRLIEMLADGGGKLSILLAGHPKLRNDLRNPNMEEIGNRTVVFSLEGVTGSQREYIEWLLVSCARNKTLDVDAIIEPAALDLLASRLRTPLQIEQHLTLAFETGYQASEKPITEAIVESVLSKQIDDLEPTLTRHGYTPAVLSEMLGMKPGEIRALFKRTLEPDRAREVKEQMLAAGLPV